MMRKDIVVFIFILLIAISAFGQQCESCKKDFNILINIVNKDSITPTDLEKGWLITKKLYEVKYTDYIDSIKNHTQWVSRSLTKTYSDLCIKSGGKIGIDYYLRYLTLTNGSAEEELSLSLERYIVKYPEIVFDAIGKNNDLLNSLAWGFINNRSYGSINPYEGDDYSAIIKYSDEQNPTLTSKNCQSIFFETNPSLKSNYNKYKYEIDYIISTAIAGLKEYE